MELLDSIINPGMNIPNDIYELAKFKILNSDLILVMGTSLNSEAVLKLIKLYKNRNQGKLIFINLQETNVDYLFDLKIKEFIDETLLLLLEEMKCTPLDFRLT